MATIWFKETGEMEGACGKILETEQAGVVVKRIHRHLKHRSKCLDARAQCEMQQWTSHLLKPANGFSLLFTPRAWLGASDEREYSMELIDCSDEINPCSKPVNQILISELKLFYEKAKESGIYPCDYELYRQSDGRIGLIDFDKFSRWNKTESEDEVVLPWGLTGKPLYPW